MIAQDRILLKNGSVPAVGSRLGYGGFGIVHDIGNGRVLKIGDCVLRPGCPRYNRYRYHGKILKMLQTLKKRKFRSVMRIYDFGKFGKTGIWYEGERLRPLSKNDLRYEEIFESIYWRSFDISNLNINNKRVLRFVKDILKLRKFGFEHYDFHCGNIMKDASGDYKVIDLESFVNYF